MVNREVLIRPFTAGSFIGLLPLIASLALFASRISSPVRRLNDGHPPTPLRIRAVIYIFAVITCPQNRWILMNLIPDYTNFSFSKVTTSSSVES